MKLLTAIPVYNEERHLNSVIREVRRHSPEILVVNDGSTDRTAPPGDGVQINQHIAAELNERYDLNLTAAFCGFKAYRVAALARLHITETGWGMPLQLWVQAAHLGLRIKEVAVPRVYLDPNRAFGGMLNNAEERLAYYRGVIARAEAEYACPSLPPCPTAERWREGTCR